MIALNTPTDFLGAIQATLGYAPQHLEPGRFYRFGPRKSGWAKLFADCLGGVFGDYRQNISSCRIPDDCIDSKRYPLFMARAVLQELIESLQSTSGATPC